MLAADAVAPVLGAVSTLFFSVGDDVLALYLGGFAGFLLYLATADILPEAARPAPVAAHAGEHHRRRRPDVVRRGGRGSAA